MKYELQNLIQGKSRDGKSYLIQEIAGFSRASQKQVQQMKEQSTQSNKKKRA